MNNTIKNHLTECYYTTNTILNIISSNIMYKHTLLLFDTPVVKFWNVVWFNKKMGVIGMFEQIWKYKQL